MNGRAFRFAALAALRSGVKPEIMHEVATVAASQHGALSVSQARELGLRRKAMYRAIELGLLTRVHSGVLVIAGAPDTWMRRLQIGLLALGGDGWISHRSAARLHGLDRFRGDDLDFTVLRGRRGARGVRRLHTTDNVGPLDVVMVNGLRCTSATRTIIDLAYIGTPESQLGPAIDSAVRLGLSAPTALARRLSQLRGRGRRGARRLDALLLDSGGETVLERAFLRLMRQAGLPRPATQVVRRRGGEHVARVDFLFESYRIVVEVSGQHGHASPTERARDAQRRNELIDLGYRTYEYTWSDVNGRPDHVVATMRTRLAQAGWRPTDQTSASSIRPHSGSVR